MLKKILCTVSLVGLTFSLASARADISVSAIVTKHNLSWSEAVGAILLADTLGLDLNLIISTRRSTNIPIYDLAPVFVIYQSSWRPINVILLERKRGKGWGVIAREMGVHPGAFNMARRSDAVL